MHYKNGREANAGDKVFSLTHGIAGILHSPSSQSSTCNGRIANVGANDPYVTVSECLHVDDIAKANIPDASKISIN